MWNVLLAGGLAGAMLVACGAPQQTDLSAENQRLRDRVSELSADSRRERVAVRDLEKRLAMIEQRRLQANAPAEAATSEPDLPVEVRTPESYPDESGLPDDYEIVGTNSEGVQIVYVGEAASEESFRPRADRYDLGASEETRARPRRRSATTRKELEPVPVVDDRLAVTRGSVPTVDSQLRQARSPAIQSRTRAAADPRAEYKRYYQALRAGNHAYATTGFRNFVTRYPEHDYADNAQYWLGEAFYDQKDYKAALIEFRRVADVHPRGNKVPDALLKMGFCHERLGDRDAAREVLGQVVALYPKSNPARLAQEKLATLEE